MFTFFNTQYLMFHFFKFLAERTEYGIESVFETEIQEDTIIVHSNDDEFIADLVEFFRN